ncbi:unnamed protein product [Prorocentrum cordatum]|uniref:Uncharacterized protein n=1 Tax=Prorocentrum cordatum TaxID=2364126 RepID=A0ABN9W4S3_9DINO|nr:unnamed protein product [Polarella glacialis]
MACARVRPGRRRRRRRKTSAKEESRCTVSPRRVSARMFPGDPPPQARSRRAGIFVPGAAWRPARAQRRRRMGRGGGAGGGGGAGTRTMYKPRASAAVKSALCPGTASWAATAERENAKSLERSDWLASTHSNLNFGAQNWLLQMLWRDNKKSCLARGRTETTRREPESSTERSNEERWRRGRRWSTRREPACEPVADQAAREATKWGWTWMTVPAMCKEFKISGPPGPPRNTGQ